MQICISTCDYAHGHFDVTYGIHVQYLEERNPAQQKTDHVVCRAVATGRANGECRIWGGGSHIDGVQCGGWSPSPPEAFYHPLSDRRSALNLSLIRSLSLNNWINVCSKRNQTGNNKTLTNFIFRINPSSCNHIMLDIFNSYKSAWSKIVLPITWAEILRSFYDSLVTCRWVS